MGLKDGVFGPYMGRRGERDGRRGIELIFLVPNQVPISYFRNLEQGHFAYLNGGDPLSEIHIF